MSAEITIGVSHAICVCRDDCLGFDVGARMPMKAILGCLFIHVFASLIHEIYLNPHLEDSSSNVGLLSLENSTFQERRASKKIKGLLKFDRACRRVIGPTPILGLL